MIAPSPFRERKSLAAKEQRLDNIPVVKKKGTIVNDFLKFVEKNPHHN